MDISQVWLVEDFESSEDHRLVQRNIWKETVTKNGAKSSLDN